MAEWSKAIKTQGHLFLIRGLRNAFPSKTLGSKDLTAALLDPVTKSNAINSFRTVIGLFYDLQVRLISYCLD